MSWDFYILYFLSNVIFKVLFHQQLKLMLQLKLVLQ